MNSWNLELQGEKPKLNNPILIEGLPGIGNVGKVAVDFIIEELKAIKLYDIFSYTFPHSVFVNENNLVELPIVEMYYKKNTSGRDLLLLAGDVQPIDEVSCYEFSEAILKILQDFGGKELITLGGIGLQSVPEKPKVYCTGNNKEIVKKFKAGTQINDKLYGVVGPIVGVSGLLVGLASKKNLNGLALLAETFGHPMYLGMKGAKEILKVLNNKLAMELNLANLDKEIREMEMESKKNSGRSKMSKDLAIRKLQGKPKIDQSYIG